MKTVFWIAILIVGYSYLLYPLILAALVRIMGRMKKVTGQDLTNLPEISLIIPAYNEKEWLRKKIENSLSLNYPREKLNIIFITDGSDDGSPEYLAQFEGIHCWHEATRQGKIAAMNRAVSLTQSPVLVFTDCNTQLSPNALMAIAGAFSNPKTGCVAGEKRIIRTDKENASGAGEGIYWRYESAIKRWEGMLSSTTGAAGELFAVRHDLYEEPEPDTILDDFIISMRIALKGYSIAYSKEAYAIETASYNLTEEQKRKVRIAAGAWQSIFRLPALLNPFKTGWLAFQYFSHKFLRWTIIPFLIPIILLLNILIVVESGIQTDIYTFLLGFQLLAYLSALLAYAMRNKKIRLKLIFIPYYVLVMNISMIRGLLRFLKGKQSVNWEKARRA